MKKKVKVIILSFLAFLGLSLSAYGAGFLIYEHGAAAMAMGGAFVAIANDPTAIFHNPAGIAFLDGTQVSVGTTLIIPRTTLTMPNIQLVDPGYSTTYDAKSQVFYPSTFYITQKITDRIVAGFGFFSPYGLGTEWPEDYPLRYIATKDDMKSFFFNPVVAVKLTDNFSAAFGVSYIRADLKFNLVNYADFTDFGGGAYDVPVAVEGSGSAWGLNAGVLYKGEKVSLGFNWRGGFSIDFEGDLTLDSSNVDDPFKPYIPPSGEVSTTFSFPHILAAGVAFNLTEKLMLSFDAHYVLWSCYDEFDIEIDYPDPWEDETTTVEENWKDSWLFRGGIQYKLSESFALRAGILYDQTPQPVETMDPLLADANRWAFTAGFGYKAGSFILDVAYLLEIFNDRTSPNRDIYLTPFGNLGEGTYSTTAHLIGVSLRFVF